MTTREAYLAVYAVAAAVSAAAALLALRHRRAVAAAPLAGTLAAGAWWAALGAVDVAAGTVAGKVLASQVEYLGVASAPAFLLFTALALLRSGRPLPRPARLAIWAPVVLILALAWTNGAHGLVWREVLLLPGGAAEYHYGPAFWAFAAVSYTAIAAATVLLTVAAWRGKIRRAALAVLAAAVVAGWITNVLYVFKLAPGPGFDWTVVGWTITGLGLTWSVVGFGLLDLVPRARQVWLEATTDGVLVLDGRGTLQFANPAARALLGPGGQQTEAAAALAEQAGQGAPRVLERAGPNGPRWLEARVDPIPDGWGHIAGRLLTLRDVSARRAAEAARERALAELQQALGEVSTLRSLLPICASCKKIRDDAGAWVPVERYLAERTGTTFTHGFCQECLERLYPAGGAGGAGGEPGR
jgi:PAS domain-containing protein